MSWSKTNKGRKPLGWWYHKIMCEFAYHFKGSSSNMYYHHLLAMSAKYSLNLYGQKISEIRRNPFLCIGDGNGTPSSPIGYALNIYLDGDKIGESKPFELSESERLWLQNPGFKPMTLEQQLQLAIETENYEEAARIRDKMNEG